MAEQDDLLVGLNLTLEDTKDIEKDVLAFVEKLQKRTNKEKIDIGISTTNISEANIYFDNIKKSIFNIRTEISSLNKARISLVEADDKQGVADVNLQIRTLRASLESLKIARDKLKDATSSDTKLLAKYKKEEEQLNKLIAEEERRLSKGEESVRAIEEQEQAYNRMANSVKSMAKNADFELLSLGTDKELNDILKISKQISSETDAQADDYKQQRELQKQITDLLRERGKLGYTSSQLEGLVDIDITSLQQADEILSRIKNTQQSLDADSINYAQDVSNISLITDRVNEWKQSQKEIYNEAKNIREQSAEQLRISQLNENIDKDRAELLRRAKAEMNSLVEGTNKWYEAYRKVQALEKKSSFTKDVAEAEKASSLQREINYLQQNGAKTRKELNTLISHYNAELDKVEINSREEQELLNKIYATRQKLNQATLSNNSALREQSQTLSELRGMMQNYVGMYALIEGSRAVFRTTAEFEMQKVALNALTKSMIDTERIWSQIAAQSVKSPFALKDLVTYTKQLSAYRVENDKLFETTSKLADISAGLGVSMDRLILAYGQVRAATVLRGTELRQFTEAGLDLLPRLADKFTELNGVATTTSDVFDLISKRMVSFEMVSEVFDDMTQAGGTFYNMQEIQSRTLQGTIVNLRDQWNLLQDAIGQSYSGIVKGAFDATKSMLQFLTVNDTLRDSIIALVATMGTLRVASMAGIKIDKAATQQKLIDVSIQRLQTNETKKLIAAEVTKQVIDKAQLATLKQDNIFQRLRVKSLYASAVATGKAAAANNILTASFYKLKAAMLANPYLAVGAALLGLGSIIWGVIRRSNEATEELRAMNEELDRFREKREVQIDFITNTNQSPEERMTKLREYVDELASKGVKFKVDWDSEQALNDFNVFADEVTRRGEEIEKVVAAAMNAGVDVYDSDSVENAIKAQSNYYNAIGRTEGKLRAMRNELMAQNNLTDKQKSQLTTVNSILEQMAKAREKSTEALGREDKIYDNIYNKQKRSAKVLYDSYNDLQDLGVFSSFSTQLGSIDRQYINSLADIVDEIVDVVNQTTNTDDPDRAIKVQAIIDKKVTESNLQNGLLPITEMVGNNLGLEIAVGFEAPKTKDFDGWKKAINDIGEEYQNKIFNITESDKNITPLEQLNKLQEAYNKNLEEQKKVQTQLNGLAAQDTTGDDKAWKIKIDAMTELWDIQTKLALSNEQLIRQADVVGGLDLTGKSSGTGSAEEVKALQEELKVIEEIRKRYLEISKAKSPSEALTEVKDIYGDIIGTMEQFDPEMVMDFIVTDEGMKSAYSEATNKLQALVDADEFIKLKLGLDLKAADLDYETFRRNLLYNLDKLSGEVANKQKANDFYNKMLGITGDEELSLMLTASVHGDAGDIQNELNKLIASSFNIAFEVDENSVKLPEFEELGISVDGVIDYRKLDEYNKKINEATNTYRTYSNLIAKESNNQLTDADKILLTKIRENEEMLKQVEQGKALTATEKQRNDIVAKGKAAWEKRTEGLAKYMEKLDDYGVQLTQAETRRNEALDVANQMEQQEIASYKIEFGSDADTTAIEARFKALREDIERVAESEFGKIELDKFLSSDFYNVMSEGIENVQIATKDSVDKMIANLEKLRVSVKDVPSEYEKVTEMIEKWRVQQALLSDDGDFFTKPIQAIQNYRSSVEELNQAREQEAQAIERVVRAEQLLSTLGEGSDSIARAMAEKELADAREAQADASGNLTNKMKGLNTAIEVNQKVLSDFQETLDLTLVGLEDAGNEAVDFASVFDDDLADSISGITGIMGGIREGATTIIGTLTQLATGAMQSMMATAGMTATAIRTVETASVILAIISAALRVATAIANFITGQQNKRIDAQIEHQQDLIDEYTSSIEDLEKTSENTFGRMALEAMAATDALRELQIEAIKAQIEAEEARKKPDDSAIQAWKDEIKELQDEVIETSEYFEKAFGTDVKSAVSSMVDEWYTAWSDMSLSQEDRIEAMKASFQELIANYVKEMYLLPKLMEQLEPAFDKVINILSSGRDLTESELGDFQDEVDAGIVAFDKYGSVIMKALEDAGYVAREMAEETEAEGLKKGYATASEEAINTLSAYSSAELDYLIRVHSILYAWQEARYGQTIAGLENEATETNYSQQIAANTAASAASAKAIQELMNELVLGSKTLKVQMPV